MGRKKIQISRITDERNRQVEKTLKIIAIVLVVIMMASMINTVVAMVVAVMELGRTKMANSCSDTQTIPGNVQQAEVRGDEEGVRVVHPVRLRDRPHHLLQQQQVVPVRQHRHGQGDDGHNGEKKKTMMNIKRRGLL